MRKILSFLTAVLLLAAPATAQINRGPIEPGRGLATANTWTATQYFSKVCFGTQASPTGGIDISAGLMRFTSDCNTTLIGLNAAGATLTALPNTGQIVYTASTSGPLTQSAGFGYGASFGTGLSGSVNVWLASTDNNATVSIRSAGVNRGYLGAVSGVLGVFNTSGVGFGIDSSGNWTASSDNTLDVGATSSTLRPRTVYAGTSVVTPLVNATTGFQVNGAAATGTILRGNGTNFVGTTATFPTTVATGNVLIASATNVVSAATPGSVRAFPANQTGNATATLKMNGLGAAAAPCLLTPATSGRVLFNISGQIVQNTTADGISFQMQYGTGTPPANGAAATGTQISTLQTHTALTGALEESFSITSVATGLSLVATWFDLEIAEVTGGTASITNVTCSALEF